MSRSLPLPDLPQEIITNILSKLPVKSLLKFKCVSKPWFSLISSSQFAKLHLQQLKLNNTASSRVFMRNFHSLDPQTYSDENSDHEAATFMEHHDVINNVRVSFFLGSCDGLVCVGSGYGEERLFVFNPTTRQVREIGASRCTEKGMPFWGFGYDYKIDDYKIIKGVIFNLNLAHGVCIEIFNLKGTSWRTIDTKDGIILADLFGGDGAFVNGVLHWLTTTNTAILRFDFVEEKFVDRMSVPGGIDYFTNVVVIDECLYLYELRSDIFSAWKMMNYGDQNSWKRVYQIRTNTFSFPQYCNDFLYITKNGHLLFNIDSEYIVFYNPVDDEIKQIGDDEEARGCKTVYIVLFLPTLQIEMFKNV